MNLPDHLEKFENKAGLHYFTKSQLKQAKSCEKKFSFYAVEGIRDTRVSEELIRGKVIHKSIEEFYDAVVEKFQNDNLTASDISMEIIPEMVNIDDKPSPQSSSEYSDELSNFIEFEEKRFEEAPSKEEYLPAGVEAEASKPFPKDETVDLFGYIDVVYFASSIPEVETDEGYVIIDFKTGDVKPKQYRDESIYMELMFYAMISPFEPVQKLGGFYIAEDEMLWKDIDGEMIMEIHEEMGELLSKKSTMEYEVEEQPLCAWGTGETDRCEYYDICPSTWAEPADQEKQFKFLLDINTDSEDIAKDLGCSVDAVEYWKSKL